MFRKFIVLICSMGIIACMLLLNRQQRLQAVNELATVQIRLIKHDHTLAKLRAEIATQMTPVHIRQLAHPTVDRLGPLEPIISPNNLLYNAHPLTSKRQTFSEYKWTTSLSQLQTR